MREDLLASKRDSRKAGDITADRLALRSSRPRFAVQNLEGFVVSKGQQKRAIRQRQTRPYLFRCLTHCFQVIRRQPDVDLQRSFRVRHGIRFSGHA